MAKKKQDIQEPLQPEQALPENPDQALPEKSFFQLRMDQIGANELNNTIDILETDTSDHTKEIKVSYPIFTETELGIDILVYTVDGSRIRYSKDGAKWKHEVYSITRLKDPIIRADGSVMKYKLPKKQPAYPFFPKNLVDKYRAGDHIDTLYLTEGYFKAFAASVHGLDIVGLVSITTLREKDTGKLHGDILSLIDKCGIKKVVFLHDADCLNMLSDRKQEVIYNEDGKEHDLYAGGIDTRKRPFTFFSQVNTFKQLLDDVKDIEKYFSHVVSDDIPGSPKGIDDLLYAMRGNESDVIDDALRFSKTNKYFAKFNITFHTGRVWEYFKLADVNRFFNYHVEKHPLLKTKKFVFNGTIYKFNPDQHLCEIVVHGDASNYIRVGDDYYERVYWVNKHKQTELRLERRSKTTITDDYGKNFIRDIKKYKTFCNVPSNINYDQTPYNNYNLYSPFEWEPDDGDCSSTMAFLTHIFGNNDITCHHPKTGEVIRVNELDLGLDYLQLLYQDPTQILPILCLVSNERETGKTTFAKWLQRIYKRNCVIVGNADLSSDFNAHWLSKLLVVCDETKIDKTVVVEKVKSLSTGGKSFMNAKGRDQVEIEIFCKFIFLSNNEDNFIYTDADEIRFWIRKIPSIPANVKVNKLEDIMDDEIPAFLDMLSKRKMATQNLSRAWFYPDLIKTDALKKVVSASKPTMEKELREKIRQKFFKHQVSELFMDVDDIQTYIFKGKKVEDNYLRKIIRDGMKIDYYTDPATGEKKTKRYSFPIMDVNHSADEITEVEKTVSRVGRPFVFHIRDFCTDDELKEIGVDLLSTKHTEQAKLDIPNTPQDDLPF